MVVYDNRAVTFVCVVNNWYQWSMGILHVLGFITHPSRCRANPPGDGTSAPQEGCACLKDDGVDTQSPTQWPLSIAIRMSSMPCY